MNAEDAYPVVLRPGSRGLFARFPGMARGSGVAVGHRRRRPRFARTRARAARPLIRAFPVDIQRTRHDKSGTQAPAGDGGAILFGLWGRNPIQGGVPEW